MVANVSNNNNNSNNKDTCCHSNSSEKPSANAGEKNIQRSKIVINKK